MAWFHEVVAKNCAAGVRQLKQVLSSPVPERREERHYPLPFCHPEQRVYDVVLLPPTPRAVLLTVQERPLGLEEVREAVGVMAL